MSATSSMTQEFDLENVCLIWLDATVNCEINSIVQKQFQSIIHTFNAFENIQDCENYIQRKSYYDRIFFIVSGRLGREIVPRIHPLRQIFSIYVYCKDKPRNEAWANKFNKVRGVIIKLDELIKRIQLDYAKRIESRLDEPFPITIYDPTNKSINNTFVHSQIILDYLLYMKSIPSDKMNVISGCLHEYNHDISQLPIVQEFEKQYVSDQSIWWYTRESFVSRLLNKALSILNLDLLFLFSFLIHDIQDRLLKDQCRSAIKVYHGQIMSIKELYLFRDYIGQCFSINTFLWATFDRKHLLRSLSDFPIGEDLVRILFEIDADPRLNSTKAFASITHSAHFSPVEQVLFQFGSVFQLMDMRHDKKNSVWIVKISLVNIREEYDQRTLLPRGQILSDMGKIDDAEKYYNRILHEIPDTHRDFARCHYLLGLLLFSKGDYELSLYWFNEVLQLFPTDDPNLANSYYSIGCIYQKKSDHCRAMRYYEEALNIWKQTCENNEPIEMAECLNNIGCIYENEKFYSKALEFHRKQLIIREKLHSCLGKTYNNIGNIYFRLGEYDVALENYTYGFALKIKTLPLDDPSLVTTLINIGLVYEYDNNIQEALKAYKRAAFLLKNVDPSSDSFHVEIQEDIQRVSALLDK